MSPQERASTHRLVETIGQSAPVDVSAPFDPARLAGKTILITGGASGFGAAFAREWASHGAHIMVGDIDTAAGEVFVAALRTATGSEHHHFAHCDVTDWASQVAFFQTAARLSPTGGIDAVVANAGIGDAEGTVTGFGIENPHDLDGEDPPAPRLKVLEVNLNGVMYTAHLALFWLERNGTVGAPAARSAPNITSPSGGEADRHLLLIGSVASLMPLVGQLQYTAAKHAVMGMFRALRATTWRQGIRVNMLCPYFVDTNIMPGAGLMMMAGGGLGSVADVVRAGTRLMADRAVVGRALVVGPRMRVVDAQGEDPKIVDVPALKRGEADAEGEAVWEIYAHDYDNVELFVWKYTRLLNDIVRIRGWMGWLSDMLWISFFRKTERK